MVQLGLRLPEPNDWTSDDSHIRCQGIVEIFKQSNYLVQEVEADKFDTELRQCVLLRGHHRSHQILGEKNQPIEWPQMEDTEHPINEAINRATEDTV